MIRFNKEELRDKVYACWIGKNIGGTLGGPFEWSTGINNCTGFTSKPGAPLPNDDLDLQLVWLKAMEELGPRAVYAKALGEYWIEYITPFWNEYGISKANMKSGLVPPLSGQYRNPWKNSNGAWIRTEIWASLFPGDVEKAIYYACEDACVDHGSAEGTYAAIFVAAIESAAFVFNDLRGMIEMGLSKIPEQSKVYKYVTTVLECFDNGKTWQETRNLLVDMSLADEELGWFQAPANIGYTIIGLLYGKNDFKETLLIACNCGDDTDCSCATAGSILGIMNGSSIIPDDWKEYIGDSIVTTSINTGATSVPATCTELTDRVMALQTITLYKSPVAVSNEETVVTDVDLAGYSGRDFATALASKGEYYATYKSILATATVGYEHAPEIEPEGSIKINISLKPNFPSQKAFAIKWYLPEGFSVKGRSTVSPIWKPASWLNFRADAEYTITAPEKVETKNTLIAVVSCDGHFDTLAIPVVLFG